MKMDITYTTDCFPEDTAIEGNCLASGDESADLAEALRIEEELAYNPWAWCLVKVTATLVGTGLQGEDYLGACSYANEADFHASLYYEDMKEQAKEDLLAKTEQIGLALAREAK